MSDPQWAVIFHLPLTWSTCPFCMLRPYTSIIKHKRQKGLSFLSKSSAYICNLFCITYNCFGLQVNVCISISIMILMHAWDCNPKMLQWFYHRDLLHLKACAPHAFCRTGKETKTKLTFKWPWHLDLQQEENKLQLQLPQPTIGFVLNLKYDLYLGISHC